MNPAKTKGRGCTRNGIYLFDVAGNLCQARWSDVRIFAKGQDGTVTRVRHWRDLAKLERARFDHTVAVVPAGAPGDPRARAAAVLAGQGDDHAWTSPAASRLARGRASGEKIKAIRRAGGNGAVPSWSDPQGPGMAGAVEQIFKELGERPVTDREIVGIVASHQRVAVLADALRRRGLSLYKKAGQANADNKTQRRYRLAAKLAALGYTEADVDLLAEIHHQEWGSATWNAHVERMAELATGCDDPAVAELAAKIAKAGSARAEDRLMLYAHLIRRGELSDPDAKLCADTLAVLTAAKIDPDTTITAAGWDLVAEAVLAGETPEKAAGTIRRLDGDPVRWAIVARELHEQASEPGHVDSFVDKVGGMARHDAVLAFGTLTDVAHAHALSLGITSGEAADIARAYVDDEVDAPAGENPELVARIRSLSAKAVRKALEAAQADHDLHHSGGRLDPIGDMESLTYTDPVGLTAYADLNSRGRRLRRRRWHPSAIDSSVRLAACFGNEWPQWVRAGQAAARRSGRAGTNIHELTYWLPTGDHARDFGTWLRRKERAQAIFTSRRGEIGLRRLGEEFHLLDDAERNLSVSDAIAALRARGYGPLGPTPMGRLCAELDVNRQSLYQVAGRWANAAHTPSPYPLDRVWRDERTGLHGYFLPRHDPRGLWLGLMTDCCQYPLSAGASCAWAGVENPMMGFFVVETPAGEVIAQSWVWADAKGVVCFDNIERKMAPETGWNDNWAGDGADDPEDAEAGEAAGRGGRHGYQNAGPEPAFETLNAAQKRSWSTRRIYEMASADLLDRFEAVTVGTSMTKVPLDGLRKAEGDLKGDPNTVGYGGYRDSHNQALLARRRASDRRPRVGRTGEGFTVTCEVLNEIEGVDLEASWQATVAGHTVTVEGDTAQAATWLRQHLPQMGTRAWQVGSTAGELIADPEGTGWELHNDDKTLTAPDLTAYLTEGVAAGSDDPDDMNRLVRHVTAILAAEGRQDQAGASEAQARDWVEAMIDLGVADPQTEMEYKVRDQLGRVAGAGMTRADVAAWPPGWRAALGVHQAGIRRLGDTQTPGDDDGRRRYVVFGTIDAAQAHEWHAHCPTVDVVRAAKLVGAGIGAPQARRILDAGAPLDYGLNDSDLAWLKELDDTDPDMLARTADELRPAWDAKLARLGLTPGQPAPRATGPVAGTTWVAWARARREGVDVEWLRELAGRSDQHLSGPELVALHQSIPDVGQVRAVAERVSPETLVGWLGLCATPAAGVTAGGGGAGDDSEPDSETPVEPFDVAFLDKLPKRVDSPVHVGRIAGRKGRGTAEAVRIMRAAPGSLDAVTVSRLDEAGVGVTRLPAGLPSSTDLRLAGAVAARFPAGAKLRDFSERPKGGATSMFGERDSLGARRAALGACGLTPQQADAYPPGWSAEDVVAAAAPDLYMSLAGWGKDTAISNWYRSKLGDTWPEGSGKLHWLASAEDLAERGIAGVDADELAAQARLELGIAEPMSASEAHELSGIVGHRTAEHSGRGSNLAAAIRNWQVAKAFGLDPANLPSGTEHVGRYERHRFSDGQKPATPAARLIAGVCDITTAQASVLCRLTGEETCAKAVTSHARSLVAGQLPEGWAQAAALARRLQNPDRIVGAGGILEDLLVPNRSRSADIRSGAWLEENLEVICRVDALDVTDDDLNRLARITRVAQDAGDTVAWRKPGPRAAAYRARTQALSDTDLVLAAVGAAERGVSPDAFGKVLEAEQAQLEGEFGVWAGQGGDSERWGPDGQYAGTSDEKPASPDAGAAQGHDAQDHDAQGHGAQDRYRGMPWPLDRMDDFFAWVDAGGKPDHWVELAKTGDTGRLALAGQLREHKVASETIREACTAIGRKATFVALSDAARSEVDVETAAELLAGGVGPDRVVGAAARGLDRTALDRWDREGLDANLCAVAWARIEPGQARRLLARVGDGADADDLDALIDTGDPDGWAAAIRPGQGSTARMLAASGWAPDEVAGDVDVAAALDRAVGCSEGRRILRRCGTGHAQTTPDRAWTQLAQAHPTNKALRQARQAGLEGPAQAQAALRLAAGTGPDLAGALAGLPDRAGAPDGDTEPSWFDADLWARGNTTGDGDDTQRQGGTGWAGQGWADLVGANRDRFSSAAELVALSDAVSAQQGAAMFRADPALSAAEAATAAAHGRDASWVAAWRQADPGGELTVDRRVETEQAGIDPAQATLWHRAGPTLEAEVFKALERAGAEPAAIAGRALSGPDAVAAAKAGLLAPQLTDGQIRAALAAGADARTAGQLPEDTLAAAVLATAVHAGVPVDADRADAAVASAGRLRRFHKAAGETNHVAWWNRRAAAFEKAGLSRDDAAAFAECSPRDAASATAEGLDAATWAGYADWLDTHRPDLGPAQRRKTIMRWHRSGQTPQMLRR